jgi:pyridoxine kinase
MCARILTIQDFSSVGRCSLTAALPVLSAMRHEAVGCPSAVLSTQTSEIEGYTFCDLSENILPSYEHWKSLGIKFDCLYSGFLGTQCAVDAVQRIARELKSSGALIAIDPAMAEDGKLYPVFDEAYFEKMSDLCKLSDVLMPNFTEGKLLAGLKMPLEPNRENATMILKILNTNGFNTVLLSGIFDENECGAAILENGFINFAMGENFQRYFYGAGDILSSVFIGELHRGKAVREAAQSAVDFVGECIKASLSKKFDPRFGLNIERVLHKLGNKGSTEARLILQ